MNQEVFQTYVASGRLTQSQVKKLLELSPGTYCLHRSWGFGKIHSFDLVLGQVIIDFQQKLQHPMQLAYAVESLTSISSDHLLALKAADVTDLKTKAKKSPVDLLRIFVKSFGETATFERLESTLCGEVIPTSDWKKWLSAAKRAAKKDGLVVWPTRKNQPIRILDKPETAADVLRPRLEKARTLPDLLAVAEEVLKKVGKSDELIL